MSSDPTILLFMLEDLEEEFVIGREDVGGVCFINERTIMGEAKLEPQVEGVGDARWKMGRASWALACEGGTAKVADTVSKVVGREEAINGLGRRSKGRDVAGGGELMRFDPDCAPRGVVGKSM